MRSQDSSRRSNSAGRAAGWALRQHGGAQQASSRAARQAGVWLEAEQPASVSGRIGGCAAQHMMQQVRAADGVSC